MNEKEKKNLWMDIFNLFDKENKGLIPIQVLQNYLQSVGIVIERKEIKNKLDENGQKDKDEFTFEELYNT